jgi:hypothetical protein
VLPPYAAYLRVYEPLAAFPERERAYWTGYAAQVRQAGPEEAPAAVDERRSRLADLIAVPPKAVPEEESGEAFVHEQDGVVYLCPWRTRLRSWLAMGELTKELPESLLNAVVPPVVRGQVETDWQRWRSEHPDARPWILTSTWNIPVRWFLLFGEEDREFEPSEEWLERETEGEQGTADGAERGDGVEGGEAGEGPEGAEGADGNERAETGKSTPGAREARESVEAGERGDGVKRRSAPSLRYRTPMAQARRRVARGYRVLRENLDEGDLVSGVEEIGRWLEEFHPRSVVELDYGGLVHVLPAGELEDDHSAADVAAGIDALRRGDGEAAGEAYARLVERWRAVRDRRSAN